MVSLGWIFYIMIIFFALIGSLRGWQREVLALTGIIGALAALNQFGYNFVISIVSLLPNTNTELPPDTFLQQRFFTVQALFLCTLAFFSYQVVARLAETVSGGRLGEKVREGFQKRFIGAIIGAMNGYLLVGGLWSFLEFQLLPTGYTRLIPGQPYPFSEEIVIRPLVGSGMTEYLPFALITPNIWLLLFFVAFFVVIIALV